MKYRDLRDFLAGLEARGELKRVTAMVDPRLEMTEICDRVLKAGGPALLFERPQGQTMPVLGNLFGTVRRVALGMGVDACQPGPRPLPAGLGRRIADAARDPVPRDRGGGDRMTTPPD